ncbi:MAG TPA: pyridoxal phosphate-dependent aminotransferase [Kiritimatiellia bacterium]|nr:pyridoxal phosphate-dependent aminotransferase [Kiritimatiellia bacterium]HPS06063.1 pyridoxal phosphate-dependent aminotransferase [Kiritimatiellia bacterium]
MNPTLKGMTPFIVMEVLEKAQEMAKRGIDVVHLEVGEPDFNMPPCAAAAAQAAYDQNRTHYTHSLGDPELREAIAALYRREYGVTVDPNCILVTSGSSPAILMALQVLCDAGDEVILSNPGYPCYRNFALACRAVPKEVRVFAENGFQYDVEAVRRAVTPHTRAIFVNSPMNPAGVLVEDAVYEGLASLGVPILSDEIYHGLVYEGRARSALEFTDNAFVLNGFSKRFAMTGLRLGYLIAPQRCMRALQILQQNLFICASSTAQRAGLAALNGAAEDVERMKAVYDERRRYMLGRLREMGFVIHTEPKGAFYIFADARKFTRDAYAFAFDVLEHAHVGITPGVDFGTAGEGFVRFSYANSLDRIREGLARLERYLAAR